MVLAKSWANVKLVKMVKQCVIIYEIERLFMDNIQHEV